MANDEDILNTFNSGEWCDTHDICRILGISFEEGFEKYEFSRTAEWNKAPLHGQKITTKFRIKPEILNLLPCGIEDDGDCKDCGYACKEKEIEDGNNIH